MSEQENLQAAKGGYEAFSRGDAEEAMANIADDIEWTVPGSSAISGTYNGKQELGELWGRYAEKNTQVTVEHWFSEGDKVVALTHVKLDGGEMDSADVLTYRDGKLVKFQNASDTALAERIYGSG